MKNVLVLSLLLVALTVGVLSFMGCPPVDNGGGPTVAPTPIPTAPPMGPSVIFDSGFFNPSLTNTNIENTDTKTSMNIVGDHIAIPASTGVDIRFDLIDASAYSKVVFTIDNAGGGQIYFYSWDTAGATGTMFTNNWGNSFWTAPYTVNFSDVTIAVYDPNTVGFKSNSLAGWGLKLNTATAITKIELQ